MTRRWMRWTLIGIGIAVLGCVCNWNVMAKRGKPKKEKVVPQKNLPFQDPSLAIDKRVDDLIGRLTLEEKTSLLIAGTRGVPRLGILPYHYWNECLHGVARAGTATVFPQAIGLAAMWDDKFLHEIADVISTEARAKYNDFQRKGKRGRYQGLTFWSPNVNIFRDPRWGRGQETYGEDPFLSGRLGIAFIKGIQGDNKKYLKACACAKHFAVHSGPEQQRHVFDAKPSAKDFHETYLPQFEATVREGHVQAVMGAYNRVYGVPSCSSDLLLKKLLRGEWGFDGHVVSDCGAIKDIWKKHKVAKTAAEATAMAIKAGCDVNCGKTYVAIPDAVKQGLLPLKDLDNALRHALTVRFKLGMFDPPEMVPWSTTPITENDSPAHKALALSAARKSIVLLKNNGILPLDLSKIKTIAVIGANADSLKILLGNYNGTPSKPVKILEGIKNACADKVKILTAEGCPLATQAGKAADALAESAPNALKAAKAADIVLFVGGISPQLEGEQMKGVHVEGFLGGDRLTIELPTVQTELLKKLKALGKPIVFVNCSGSAVAMPVEILDAVVQAWYPGQAGGTAVADVLFGKYNPAGRLPVTFYRSTKDLPPFEDYSMKNRTYKFFTGKPLFAFGHGLSYTEFKYSNGQLENNGVATDGTIKLKVTVANVGKKDGDEVVQIYAKPVKPSPDDPKRILVAFTRVTIPAGKTATIPFEIPAKRLALWDEKKQKMSVKPGKYILEMGAASDDIRATADVTIE